MLRFIFILFILSLVGLNSTLTHFLGNEGAATAVKSFVSSKESPGNGSITARLTSYAAETAGLATNPIPPEGCQPMANPEHLQAMLDSIPAEQREYILRAMATAPNMPVALYEGPLGHGFCLPDMGMMVNLPTANLANSLNTGASGAASFIQGLLPPAPAQ